MTPTAGVKSARTASGGLSSLEAFSEPCAPPAAGSLADEPFEHGREVGLCLEPHGQCNVQQIARGMEKEPFGGLDLLQENEVMRPAAGRKTELRCKMRPG